MEDAGLSDEVPGVVGEKVALSRHHGGRDCAFVAADDRIDPERQAIARLIDRGVEALAPTGVARRGQVLDRPERRADRADAGEKRVAGEIVSARQRRARGRQQARLELDIVAGRDVGRVAGRHSDPARNLLLRHAVGADDADHHARADGPQVHFLDKALQRDDADAVEHRRGDPRRAQRHRQETARTARRLRARGRGREAGRGENHASAAKRAVISAGSHRTGSRSAARLSATPPIAATGIHRKKRRSSTSRVKRARERAAPVRRPRGRAGPAGRRGESASAGRCRHSGVRLTPV